MSELAKCIEWLEEAYPGEIELYPRKCGDDVLQLVPEPLREFYSLYDSGDFPFGHIFPPEEALNDPISKQAFGDEWFQFGCDEYFTFWLCRTQPDELGLWFDPWDHDSETDPEPVFADLPTFLHFVEGDSDIPF